MFREPEDRQMGERPEDPGTKLLRCAIVLIAIPCIGMLAAAFYLFFANHPTFENILSVYALSMVAAGGLYYLYVALRDLKRGLEKWLRSRKRIRTAVFTPPWL